MTGTINLWPQNLRTKIAANLKTGHINHHDKFILYKRDLTTPQV